jgi:uncharacterized protein YukJ
MPVNNYGVLKGLPINTLLGSNDSPHFQILIKDNSGNSYRIAVNIKSQGAPSDVLYYVSDQINPKETIQLLQLSSGFTPIHHNQPPIGLDFIRRKWFDPAQMVPLPPEVQGPNNDLNDKIQYYIHKAIEAQATIYAFGDKWGPEKNLKDRYFGFLPGEGIHDIHMNQGNSGRWEKDNGIYQDGGILIQLQDKWVGIFLAFQSQSWCTDDHGDPLKPVEKCNHLKINIHDESI